MFPLTVEWDVSIGAPEDVEVTEDVLQGAVNVLGWPFSRQYCECHEECKPTLGVRGAGTTPCATILRVVSPTLRRRRHPATIAERRYGWATWRQLSWSRARGEGLQVINADKPTAWKADVLASVQLYNDWFLEAAPQAYRDTRQSVVHDVERLFAATNEMRNITADVIRAQPEIVATLRMATAPPIARDRLTGLADLPNGLVKTLEDGKLPLRTSSLTLQSHLQNICVVIDELLDTDLFDWLDSKGSPDPQQRELAAVVVSDRRCGAVADPIVRNAQETRQLAVIEQWLAARGYTRRPHPGALPLQAMAPGTFSFRQNVVVQYDSNSIRTNMPIDAVIQPHTPLPHGYPLLVEAKSAGDFTNTNKRRKEEATKIRQLRSTYGNDVQLVLFLCGYFDAGYLGYEAAEGLDWVWEHRPDDFVNAGL